MPLLTSTTTSYADPFAFPVIANNNGVFQLTSVAAFNPLAPPEISKEIPPEVTLETPFQNLASLRKSKTVGRIRVRRIPTIPSSPTLTEYSESSPTSPKFPPRRSSLTSTTAEIFKKLPPPEEDEFLIAPPIIIDEVSERSVDLKEPSGNSQAGESVDMRDGAQLPGYSGLLKVPRNHKPRRRAPLPESRNLFGNPASLAPSCDDSASWTDEASGCGSSHLFRGVQNGSISQFSEALEVEEPVKIEADLDDLDEATMDRTMGRKHALEELIRTEEYYVQDLWSLKTFYVPLLRQCQGLSPDTIESIEQTVSDMYSTHTTLINDLWDHLPYLVVMPSGHLASKERDASGPLSTTNSAQKVAEVFEEIVDSFFVYEEYFVGHREVLKNAHRHQLRPELGRGLEVLTGAMNSWDNRAEYGKRALELSDMLCKPIQRLCKYPLLFKEILRNTPSIDCPKTNRLLEKVLRLLEEQVSQTNAANLNTPAVRTRVQKTRLLHNRLKVKRSMTLDTRRLGHVILCGALHVITQSVSGDIPNEYMACMLYKSYLVIATTSVAANYEVKFAIRLALAHIEEADTGKGLYSPNAPQTWKIVFEANGCAHEVLLTASDDDEKSAWLHHLQDRINVESTAHLEYTSDHIDCSTVIPSNMKPVSELRGKPGSLARKQSLHQTGASVLQSNGRYIIVDNMNYSGATSPGSSFSENSVPVVYIKRADRNRAEFNLRDVWTKELVPFSTVTVTPTKEKAKAKTPPNIITRGLKAMKLLPSKNNNGMVEAISLSPTSLPSPKKTPGSLERRFSLVRSTKSEPGITGLATLKRSSTMTRFGNWKSAPPSRTHSETESPVLKKPAASAQQKHRHSAPALPRMDLQQKEMAPKMRSNIGLEQRPSVISKAPRRYSMLDV